MARYLINANLPRRFSIWNDASCVFVVNLGCDLSDVEVWDYAVLNELTIVTKNADFALRVLVSSGGPHVIHLRVGNMRLRELYVFLHKNWPQACEISREYRLVEVFDDEIRAIS